MSDEPTQEIWSEFFRIKNRLIDYDENLRESVTNIRMLMTMGYGMNRLKIHYAKAQKHVGLVLNLGIACGAISVNADKEKIEKAKDISRGKWSGIEDFEKVQDFFNECYRETRFYDVSVQKDNRPAVIKKYGRSPGGY